MLKDPNAADQVRELLFEVTGQLYDSIRLVQETCSEDDIAAYKRAMAQVLCQIFTKILGPISDEHPIESPNPDKPFRRHPMIANVDTAKQVSELMFVISNRLEESLDIARNAAATAEFKLYAKGIGTILADIMYEVLNPVFAQHPSIAPTGWK